jgi:hypothetical protein
VFCCGGVVASQKKPQLLVVVQKPYQERLFFLTNYFYLGVASLFPNQSLSF